jgi:hypothetical protein
MDVVVTTMVLRVVCLPALCHNIPMVVDSVTEALEVLGHHVFLIVVVASLSESAHSLTVLTLLLSR